MLDLVYPLLAAHLTVGETFRLRRALGLTNEHEDIPTASLLAHTKLGLKRNATVRGVSDKMQTTSRCIECGRTTQSAKQVCYGCLTDEGGFRSVMTRRQITVLMVKHGLRPRVADRIIKKVKVVAIFRSGAYGYEPRAVKAQLERYIWRTS